MGYRSHFALRRAGQTQLFASHWGGYRLLRDLLHGPAPVQAYVETRKPCDDLYYGDSVDGVALLDLDARTLCFWGGDNLEIESVPALRRPYLRLLEQFVSVYRNRSFRSAAEDIGIAQSSVTKRIQHLEEEVFE